MNRKRLIGALKLVVVAALMAWVFTSIQWRDTYVTVMPDGERVEVEGDIRSDWEQPAVRFQPEGSEQVLVLHTGPQDGGRVVQVAPGFLTYVRQLNVGLFLLGAVAYFMSVLVSSARWWWLLRVNRLQVTLGEAVRFTWIGIFFNNVVPGATGGDLVKALYIMKHCPGGRVQALVSVIVDRVLGLGSLALLGAIVVLFALDEFRGHAIAIWGGLAGVALIGTIAFSRRLRRLVRLDQLLNRLPPGLSRPLKRIDQAVFFYRSHKAGILWWIVGGMGIHVFSVFAVVLTGMALGVGLPVFDYFVLIPIINVVSAIPIAPNGWGVGEALYKFLFEQYGTRHVVGVAAETMGTRGVALSVLFRIHLTLWSLLGGLLVLFEKERVTKADMAEEAALERAEAAAPEAGTGVSGAGPSGADAVAQPTPAPATQRADPAR